MKIEITGASAFVRRMYEACGKYQWARELLKNSGEAGATRVEFGIEWQAVEKEGVYRRTVIDDGVGMDARELLHFFSTLGAGSKTIGGVHDNFGVGAKIAALPWNENGVVVVSYKDGKGSMIWIEQNPNSGDYELRDWTDEDGRKVSVLDPEAVEWDEDEPDWGDLRPDWVTDHGTIIVLLGNDTNKDTVLGNIEAGEGGTAGLTRYLNERFWDLETPKVIVSELRSILKTQWPQSQSDRDDKRRPNNRTIRGARHFICDATAPEGELKASGVELLDEGRVKAHWFLWGGKRPLVHSQGRQLGYIAVKYGDELYEHTAHKAHFRWFGIIEKAVQDNLTVILEPQLYQPANGRWGIHPDQSRTRLIFTGSGEKGAGLPTADWGAEFSNNLPSDIYDAILAARKNLTGSVEDDEYRRRLQDRFGSRWRRKVLVAAPKKTREPKFPASLSQATSKSPGPNHSGSQKKNSRKIKRKSPSGKNAGGTQPVMAPGGKKKAVEKDVPVDLPRWVPAGADDFEKPWHLAAYSPNAPGGPVVQINIESKIIVDMIDDHKKNYASHHAEEVANTVIKVFGEVAVAKVAHAQALTYEISEQEVDERYRSEEALTLALMGLIAEETLISQRLGRLGRKTKAA